jgi:putative membrane protein
MPQLPVDQFYLYLKHLLSGLIMVGLFAAVYVRFTPFHEMPLIRRGCTAAALSLAGAIIGFSLTVASSILHNDHYLMFVAWGTLAAVVQVAAYLLIERSLPEMKAAIEANNMAMGALMGTVSLVVGVINAACLS